MEVRGRQKLAASAEAAAPDTLSTDAVVAEPAQKRAKLEQSAVVADAAACILIPDSDDEAPAAGPAVVPNQLPSSSRAPEDVQLLRISSGRAAAAAGIHPYADAGELFLELVYQDLPELLISDAEIAGVELVSPQVERARLLAKSGHAELLEGILKEAATAPGIEGAQVAREAVAAAVAKAEAAQLISLEEASDLRNSLELEINLEFGARHEDAALAAYETRIGRRVYGQQLRISVPLPAEGAAAALGVSFPPPHSGVRPSSEESATSAEKAKASEATRPYFRLTGFVDGLADVPGAVLPRLRQALGCSQALRSVRI